MKFTMKKLKTTITTVALIVGTSMLAVPAHAQTPPPDRDQLLRLAPFFFSSTANRLRSNYTSSWQLLLQRTGPLARVAENAGSRACLNRVLNRGALGCNPADRNCANAVNTRQLRELTLIFIDLFQGAGLVNVILPSSAAKTDLINSATFQTLVVRRTLANLLADRSTDQFVSFNSLLTRAAPTASSPLPARVESNCDVNDAQTVTQVPFEMAPGFPFEGLQADTAFRLMQAIDQSPNREALCANAVSAFGDLGPIGGPCGFLTLVNLNVGGGGAFIP